MKKFSLLLLTTLMALCLFTACSNDDEDEIVGKWRYTKTVPGEVKTSDQTATDLIKAQINDVASDDVDIIEFTSDGRLIFDEEDDEYTYTISGNKLTVKSVWGVETTEFSISDGTLNVYIDETEEYEYDRDYLGIDEDVVIEKVISVEQYKKM